jgi:2-dehydropantoate 2-reductase
MSATAAMMSQQGSPFVSSMYRDLMGGAQVEVDAILQDLVDRGHAKGVETPLLQAAAAQLHIYQAAKAGGRG